VIQVILRLDHRFLPFSRNPRMFLLTISMTPGGPA